MPMKKRSTLTFIVKKFSSQSLTKSDCTGDEYGEASSEDECLSLCPSDQSVRMILDFARAYEVMKTKTAGYVEMILN